MILKPPENCVDINKWKSVCARGEQLKHVFFIPPTLGDSSIVICLEFCDCGERVDSLLDIQHESISVCLQLETVSSNSHNSLVLSVSFSLFFVWTERNSASFMFSWDPRS